MERFAAVTLVDGDGEPVGLFAVIDREAEPEGDDDVPHVYESSNKAEVTKLAKTLNKPVKRGEYQHVEFGDSGLLLSPGGSDICSASAEVADDLKSLLKARQDHLAGKAT